MITNLMKLPKISTKHKSIMTTEQIQSVIALCKGEPIEKVLQSFIAMCRQKELDEFASYFGCPADKESVAECLSKGEYIKTETTETEQESPVLADETETDTQESEETEETADETAEADETTEQTEEKPTGSAEKKAEKKETLSAYEKAVLAEMERRAKGGDELLATALQSKDKNIKECFRYVTQQARKKAVSGCAMIEDAVVFGWAHHYYIESKETIDAEMKPKSTPNTAKATAKAKETPKPKANVVDITKAITAKPKEDSNGKKRKAEKKKDNLFAGFVPMERPESEKDAKKGSREQAKSVVQMDMFADFFAE